MSIDPRDRQRILEIAREVRKHVRKEAGAYCPPGGLCGEASLALSARLRRAGIEHEVVLGKWVGPVTPELVIDEDPSELSEEALAQEIESARYHVWVVFPQYNGAILDVTADQYHDVPGVWFPAQKNVYEPYETLDPEELIGKEATRGKRNLGFPLSGPRFRRPFKDAKVRVREHLKRPPRSCLCHKSKFVNRARKSLVRRLK